jgi:hypothetical protein
MVSFDHDLADTHYSACNSGETIDYDSLEEKTGYDCAKWMVEYCVNQGFIELPVWYTHTMNPVGGKNIQDLFNNYTKHRNE